MANKKMKPVTRSHFDDLDSCKMLDAVFAFEVL